MSDWQRDADYFNDLSLYVVADGDIDEGPIDVEVELDRVLRMRDQDG